MCVCVCQGTLVALKKKSRQGFITCQGFPTFLFSPQLGHHFHQRREWLRFNHSRKLGGAKLSHIGFGLETSAPCCLSSPPPPPPPPTLTLGLCGGVGGSLNPTNITSVNLVMGCSNVFFFTTLAPALAFPNAMLVIRKPWSNQNFDPHGWLYH